MLSKLELRVFYSATNEKSASVVSAFNRPPLSLSLPPSVTSLVKNLSGLTYVTFMWGVLRVAVFMPRQLINTDFVFLWSIHLILYLRDKLIRIAPLTASIFILLNRVFQKFYNGQSGPIWKTLRFWLQQVSNLLKIKKLFLVIVYFKELILT